MNSSSGHSPSPALYYRVWAALMVLLFLTWSVARLDLGMFNAVAAMTIAVVKLLLVLLYFMHVRYQSKVTWVFAAAGFYWLMIMFTLTMGDYLTRTR
jgi:cytochrome c oxidase subunit IV